MNIGDTFHGGGEALFSNGNAIVDPVNALNVDIGVPGNWDFAFGPVVTNARYGNLINEEVKRPNYELLAANATYRIPPQLQSNPIAGNLVQNVFNYTAGDEFLPASKIIEKSGVKIGFIGITSDIVERMHPVLAFNIEFAQGENAYLDLIETNAASLRSEGANIVVVMSELGIQKDWALANQLSTDTVQVIFSAHTHEVTPEPLVSSSGTLVVEAGNDSYLGQMDVTFDNGSVSSTNWQLHRLDESVEEDSAMLALVEQARAAYVVDNPNLSIPSVSIGNGQLSDLMPSPSNQTLSFGLDQHLHTTELPLTRLNALESHFNNFYTDLLRLTNSTDVAMTPGFRFNALAIPSLDAFKGDAEDYIWQSEVPELLDGELTIGDVYRYFPAPYNIATGQIRVGQLKEIIETNLTNVFSTTAFNQSGGWVDGFSGLSIDLDLGAPDGNRINEIAFEDGTPLADDRMISVTGCARPFDMAAETTLCSYDGFENVTMLINPANGESYTAADYLIDHLMQNNGLIEEIVSRKTFNDQSTLTQWPNSPYLQPLEGAQ